MINVGIVGASGYGGLELMRWLAAHPNVELKEAQSSTSAGQPVAHVFPSLSGTVNIFFSDSNVAGFKGCDVVFLAVENGRAAGLAKEILDLGCKVIDLSADHRFRDASGYNTWYSSEHPSPEQTANAVYGLPEIHWGEIEKASLVGNPGCYATATILALAPLLSNKLIELNSIVVDGKSGLSGAGRSSFSLPYHFAEANESVTPYKVAGSHRHTGEIEQELSAIAGSPLALSFTPHLVPMTRGVLASCYAALKSPLDSLQVKEVYEQFYATRPFVKIVGHPPSTKQTVGSNRCDIYPAVDTRTGRVSVFAAIDNLGKGMASQAIQNMNIMFGLDQTTGLKGGALWP